MGKFYCTVEGKWCKLLRKDVCGVCKAPLSEVVRCPRMTEIETERLYEILREVDFDKVYDRLEVWFPDQKDRRDVYRKVYDDLLEREPKIHHLNDLFIEVEVWDDGECRTLDVTGKDLKKNRWYAIEFCPWNDWVSMYVTRETLDTMEKEDIVAGCLYEMTYSGWTDDQVQQKLNRMVQAFKEMKEELKK